MNVFVYGSLRERWTTIRILGRAPERRDGYVPGFEVGWLHGDEWGLQNVRPASDRIAHGDVLLGLTAEELSTLDRFEGHPGFYRRETVTAIVGGEPVEVEMYRVPDTVAPTFLDTAEAYAAEDDDDRS